MEASTKKIMERPLLPNEVLLDAAGKTPDEVLAEAADIVERYKSRREYDYVLPAKEQFYSWVLSDGLRA